MVFPCIQVGRNELSLGCLLLFWVTSTNVFSQTIQKIPLNVMTLEIVTKRVYTAKVKNEIKTHCNKNVRSNNKVHKAFSLYKCLACGQLTSIAGQKVALHFEI